MYMTTSFNSQLLGGRMCLLKYVSRRKLCFRSRFEILMVQVHELWCWGTRGDKYLKNEKVGLPWKFSG